jgi:hypothetical protein
MNANQRINADPSDDTTILELTGANPTGPSSRRPEMVPVTADDLGKVEGGSGAVVVDDNTIGGRSDRAPIITHR